MLHTFATLIRIAHGAGRLRTTATSGLAVPNQAASEIPWHAKAPVEAPRDLLECVVVASVSSRQVPGDRPFLALRTADPAFIADREIVLRGRYSGTGGPCEQLRATHHIATHCDAVQKPSTQRVSRPRITRANSPSEQSQRVCTTLDSALANESKSLAVER